VINNNNKKLCQKLYQKKNYQKENHSPGLAFEDEEPRKLNPSSTVLTFLLLFLIIIMIHDSSTTDYDLLSCTNESTMAADSVFQIQFLYKPYRFLPSHF
jgi:hypothetical protein